MIKAIVIDDEVHCIETLRILLGEYCPDVQIIEECRSAKQGLLAIGRLKPDLVFLDVEMPAMNGFEMLEQLPEIDFSVVFTTGYDQYAIKAIRFSALDYLLKPIDHHELAAAVRKIKTLSRPAAPEQFTMLSATVHNREIGFTKIAIPTAEGFELIPAEMIISCEADDNYTCFYLKDKSKMIACRTLKEVEAQLEPFSSFVRVHHSYIANLNEVARYVRGEGGYVVMSDGRTITVSRSKKEHLLKRITL
jgi:two-component system LytT family response regulator